MATNKEKKAAMPKQEKVKKPKKEKDGEVSIQGNPNTPPPPPPVIP